MLLHKPNNTWIITRNSLAKVHIYDRKPCSCGLNDVHVTVWKFVKLFGPTLSGGVIISCFKGDVAQLSVMYGWQCQKMKSLEFNM